MLYYIVLLHTIVLYKHMHILVSALRLHWLLMLEKEWVRENKHAHPLYEEFARLSETRLAQNTLNYIKILR